MLPFKFARICDRKTGSPLLRNTRLKTIKWEAFDHANNVYWYRMFGPAHIKGKGSLRKRRGSLSMGRKSGRRLSEKIMLNREMIKRRYWRPLTDPACSLKQQRTRVTIP